MYLSGSEANMSLPSCPGSFNEGREDARLAIMMTSITVQLIARDRPFGMAFCRAKLNGVGVITYFQHAPL